MKKIDIDKEAFVECWNCHKCFHDLDWLISGSGNVYCPECGANQSSSINRKLIEAIVESYAGF